MKISLQALLYKRIRISKSIEIDLVYILWFALAFIAVVSEMSRGLTSIDNYLIFRGVFDHVVDKKYLFSYYPDEYVSFNNYGPAFSLIIAPFALLPVYIGCFLWAIANATALFIGIRMLPVKQEQKILIYWVVMIEMMTSIHSVQFNPMFTSFILFAFVFTLKGKDWIATLFITLGILSKLYGVAGLAFFFFSKNKKTFALSFIGWMIVIVLLPICYSGYAYIMQSYEDWYYQIIKRNNQNILNSKYAGMQDISVPGMIRRIFNYYGAIDFKIIALSGVFFLVPLLKRKKWENLQFQLSYLAIILISIVIFSSAAESPTFVIAVTGAAIWLILQQSPYSSGVKAALVLLFILTIISPTDIIPKYLRDNYILRYSLKALPCFVIWCWLTISTWKNNFSKTLHK
jgi:hypothetical protein